MKPLAIDLFCGLGGWTDGLLAEGYDVVGFDITRHEYGENRYPAQLVLQDVTTLDGGQFRDAALIVASPPCQEYSYMAMPWSLAKAKAADIRADATGAKLAALNRLFDACFRIQREACAASGRHIPMVVENVRGAQPWVGRSRWAFGSFHLWGDVPALMPVTKVIAKRPGHDWNRFKETGEISPHWRMPEDSKHGQKVLAHLKKRDGNTSTRHPTNPAEHIKNSGGSWFNIAHNTTSGHGRNPDGRKVKGLPGKTGDGWFGANNEHSLRQHSSKSSKRKAASAMIAKIPLTLSSHIARTFYPNT